MTEPHNKDLHEVASDVGEDVVFKAGDVKFDLSQPMRRPWWKNLGDWLGLKYFGPRDVISLELEERRQLNGLRKLMVVIALIVLAASVYSCYLFAFEGWGYPDYCLIDNPYVWFAYLGRTGASVLVMLLVLNALFKLVSKEKQPDNDKVPFEVLSQLKNMVGKGTSEVP